MNLAVGRREIDFGRELTGLVPSRVPGLARALSPLTRPGLLAPALTARFRALW